MLKVNSLIASSGLTGSLSGTATQAVTASFISGTIDFPNGLIVTGSVFSTTGFTGSLSGSITSAATASYVSGVIDFQNGLIITGTLNVSGGVTSSLGYFGTASFANRALSASWAPGGGGISSITVIDEGVVVGTAQALNFIGSGVSAAVTSNTGSITIVGGGGGAIAVQDENLTRSTTIEVLNFVGLGVSSSISGVTASVFVSNTGSYSGTITSAVSSSYVSGVIDFQNGLIVTGTLNVSGGVSSSLGYFGTASYANQALSASWAPGGGLPTFTRTTSFVSTSVLTQNSFQTGTVTLAPGFVLYRIATSVPARVRLYTTTTARNNDRFRGTNVEPTGSHDLIIDILTVVGNLTSSLAPIPYGAVLDEPATANVAYTITNNQTGSAAVTSSFLFLPLE